MTKYLTKEQISKARPGDSILISARVVHVCSDDNFYEKGTLKVRVIEQAEKYTNENPIWEMYVGSESHIVEIIPKDFEVGDTVVAIDGETDVPFVIVYMEKDSLEMVIKGKYKSSSALLFVVQKQFFRRR